MVILGIDPGSRFTGFGLVGLDSGGPKSLDFGVLSLSPSGDLAARLGQLSRELENLIETHKPDVMVVEKLFFAKNADSAFKLGHARGVVLGTAGKFGLKLSEYAAKYVKKQVAGSGGASKEQVRFWVEKLLNVTVNQVDASDALALSLCYVRDFEGKQKLKKLNSQGVQL